MYSHISTNKITLISTQTYKISKNYSKIHGKSIEISIHLLKKHTNILKL